MLLFLDIDGVLHPIDAGERDEFRSLPRLEGILRDYPEVRVVIASDRRLGEPLERIRNSFAVDIRPRIIGGTPFLEDEGGRDPTRWLEIRAWLMENNHEGTQFVILDDSRHLFPPKIQELICCDPQKGITDEIEQMLRARLTNAR